MLKEDARLFLFRLFDLALISYGIAWFHFVSEFLFFGTAGTKGAISPFIVSSTLPKSLLFFLPPFDLRFQFGFSLTWVLSVWTMISYEFDLDVETYDNLSLSPFTVLRKARADTDRFSVEYDFYVSV